MKYLEVLDETTDSFICPGDESFETVGEVFHHDTGIVQQ
jgi:hypothetical protein